MNNELADIVPSAAPPGKTEGKAEGKTEGKAEGKTEGKAEGKEEVVYHAVMTVRTGRCSDG